MDLALVILATDDLPRLADFYGQVTGWQRLVDEPVYVELTSPGGVRLGLYDVRSFGANLGTGAAVDGPPRGISRAELYLVTEDLGSAVARALGAGGRLLSAEAARPWGDTVAYLSDPDGNVCALAAR